jgi:drug/metabolite transporter (DMT)-like permease
MPTRTDWLGAAIVLVAASLFATLGTLSRTAYDAGLTPFAWVAWRAFIGSIGLWSLIAWRRGAWRRGPGSLVAGLVGAGRRAKGSLAIAILAGAALNLSIFVAFQRTTIALALLCFYTYPAIVAVGAVLLGRERLDATRVVALLLALGGMAAVVGGGLGSTSVVIDPMGIGLALVAALCQSVFVLSSRGYAGVPTDEAMASILTGSVVVAIVVTAVTDGPAALAFPLGLPGLLLLLVGVGLFAAAIPSFLFLTGIRRLGAVRTGILMLFEPVVGVALAAAFLAESLTVVQAIGGATILLAAGIVQRSSGGEHEPNAPVLEAPGGL